MAGSAAVGGVAPIVAIGMGGGPMLRRLLRSATMRQRRPLTGDFAVAAVEIPFAVAHASRPCRLLKDVAGSAQVGKICQARHRDYCLNTLASPCKIRTISMLSHHKIAKTVTLRAHRPESHLFAQRILRIKRQ